ncbi:Peptidase family S41 [Treponema bryantii]|uniref:Peptidase family S41 n=1 Tax=Treponema bryantii TaxID=163 RepID=A0A1H9HHA6_9SPIR|nr:S41 family peptidase [Treponema bryantii]SEQ61684.1 Peptidase family S41 [Treponema bryantii]
MKYKKIELILILGLLGLNLFAMEDRSDHIVGYQWYEEPERVDLKKDFTLNECVENLKDIVYLLESSYIGFDEMEKRGFDKEAFIKNSESLFSNEKTIKLEKLSEYIFNSLKPYINDGHFYMRSGDNSYKFYVKKVIYLSDTYVMKSSSRYKVVESGQISPGIEIDISEENLFKTIHNGKEVFRLGVLASNGERDYTKFLPVSVNGEKIRLTCTYFPKTLSSNEFTVIETKNSVYINIPIFDTHEEHFEVFKKLGKKYWNKKNLIIDLRQNPGGENLYFYDFLYDLYSGEDDESIRTIYNDYLGNNIKTKNISSPLIKQLIKPYYDYYMSIGEKLFADELLKVLNSSGITYKENSTVKIEKKTKFKGNLIFLTSKKSASCSEDIIMVSKELFNKVYTVGTNTSGSLLFGNVFTYGLKNSGIILKVCQTQYFYNDVFEEGRGIMPDYVVSGSFEDTIKFLTNDKEMVKKLAILN